MSAVEAPTLARERAAGTEERIAIERSRGPRVRGAARVVPAWLLTATLALAYLLMAPASSDLAAAGYRSDLFARAGFTLWDNGWYGGHHLPAYSLLAPPLGALLGPALVGGLAATIAAGLFPSLVRGGFTPRAERVAALWFALGAGIELFTNRIPFELGAALALGALVAARAARATAGLRRARWLALATALALLCPLASPVAGAFLALAALAWALGGRRGQARFAVAEGPPQGLARELRRTRLPLALGCAALAPIVLLWIAFPEGGSEPFVASAFYPELAATLALALAIPRRRRGLRMGAALYALALAACYVLSTPVGGNVSRLGALLAGPVLACALIAQPPGMYVERRHRMAGWRSWLPRGWRAAALLALAPLLLYWQLRAPIADLASSVSEPATNASYYAPLVGELRRLGLGYGERPARVEVVPTRNHGEARWVAAQVPLARGWERQLDVRANGVFYRGRDSKDPRAGALTAARYRAWLSREAVAYVALPDASLDYSARAEARLLRGGPSWLHEVWRSPHWRLFEVLAPTPLAQPPSTLVRLGPDSFALRAPSAGGFLVRVHFTPYWALLDGHGCVQRGSAGYTEVRTLGPGTLRVGIDFSPARVFDRGPRCR
ncbi:MAG TPA: hypothetical protein VN672_10475 [Solirubrobacteraceae bacterium]|nr:hypothetical protein [Solirubrobacteraceae bacterium]